ncbi:hypothetical protein [Seonamhaeicola maritimus]|uniref:Cytochrome b561 bacterial/Ni-hydrogenase domain-containing protein n=1 Tax=Seonamhaeicola maritimus TaxID=2591822 RepID=A0A5C7GF32_9FLAO|nr:hypothetical protein [Seonamhaeicola maritimus]TXG35357.1 hypothetical protein FUA22_16550 [Seonamhaeicola maritimus]
MILSNNKSTYLGLFLFVAYFVQFFFKIEWSGLEEFQQDQMYKRWSGLLVALLIVFQWLLSVVRTSKKLRKYAMPMQNVHKWLGALSPLVFYFHSVSLGYGYLLLLSYIFFSNTILGYFNLDVIKSNNETFFKGWMISHVALSLIITILMVFHIVMVFYYK